MGADLYYKGQDVPILGFEVSQHAIDVGYFRDAYNEGSVLYRYGLSWWRDIVPLQNADGVITLKNVEKFREMLSATGYDSKDDDHARLLEKYLDTAIDKGYEIEASL